jgi:hypothetical protein
MFQDCCTGFWPAAPVSLLSKPGAATVERLAARHRVGVADGDRRCRGRHLGGDRRDRGVGDVDGAEVTVMATVSVSVKGPPEPVLPRSLVATWREGRAGEAPSRGVKRRADQRRVDC